MLIPSARGASAVRRVLAALDTCTVPTGWTIRVIVIENGNTARLLHECDLACRHRLEILFQPVPGKAKALNFALDSIGDELCIFFDDDIEIAASAVSAYLDAAQRFGPGHFLGGPCTPLFETEPPRRLALYPFSVRGLCYGDVELVARRNHFLGSNWAAFASDLRRVGGFDARFGPGSGLVRVGEEWELQSRLLEAGVRDVYLPDASIRHRIRAEQTSLSWLLDRHYQMGLESGMRVLKERRSYLRQFLWRVRAFASVSSADEFGVQVARIAGFLRGGLHWLWLTGIKR
ncbi:hypothetical protein MAE02_70570 [Microvirga aerophila]|uniref:Glycosyltransferase 2-like domain-containing protein n=1 Tax=Microvirga aerophila TaxID=670291 RepID=A0A512C590_9HYPH|nr:hypothetical protein MAE02_70570 [Microvirga aerophila]